MPLLWKPNQHVFAKLRAKLTVEAALEPNQYKQNQSSATD